MLAERSDIQEEVVRMQSHVRHFVALLDGGGEVGKKLDFLLQEMNREANTMLSKISGVAGEALKMTELGLAMKPKSKNPASRFRTWSRRRNHGRRAEAVSELEWQSSGPQHREAGTRTGLHHLCAFRLRQIDARQRAEAQR
jgi:hypothetical protein